MSDFDEELTVTGYDSVEEEEEEKAEGGYDCEFVNPPPDAIQAECPICLQILKEPCVIDCRCGQKMCREYGTPYWTKFRSLVIVRDTAILDRNTAILDP